MTHKQRLQKLIKDHYNGQPWLDVTIYETIDDITYTEAATNIKGLNSIWQIMIHMMEWRKTNMNRTMGIITSSPHNNYIYEVTDISDKKWKQLKAAFDATQKKLLSFIENFDTKQFDTVYASNQMTYYEHLQGILQHDAYHLGQIVLIKKLLRS